MDGVAVESHFAAGGLFPEEILKLEVLHKVLEEKIPDVQPGGGRSSFL